NVTYAHMHYLAETGLPIDPLLVVPNDIALLVLAPNLKEPPAGQLAELEAVLKPALDHYGPGELGVFAGAELASVIQRVRAEGKAGLLMLLNERNKPIAYLSIGPGPQSFIMSIAFKNLTRNLALFELFYLKPGGTYLFQPAVPFPGPSTPEMITPAEALLEEALRRSAETPQLMAALGGADARYVPLEGASLNPQAVPASARSRRGRLWQVLDGYVTLSQLSGCVETDTYQALRCISEMASHGLVGLQAGSPFPGDGRLGTPLISAPSDTLKEGEPLAAFYLDCITGK